MNDPPRTIVAMRWPLMLDAVASAVQTQMEVAGLARNVESALDLAERLTPDAVITGSDIDGGGGCALCAAIKAQDRLAASVRVLVIGAGHDQGDLVEAVHAGADAYVAEEDGLTGLRDALDRLRRGEASIPSAMLGGLLRTLIRDRREEDVALERFSRLTNRERQVLALIVAGHDNAGIAKEMVVSTNTARTHVQNLFRKLEVGSRLEAASLVTSFGLLDRFPVEGNEGT